MQNSKLFTELKLRAGFGRVGNQEIGDVNNVALYATRYGFTQNQLTPGFWEQYMNIGTAYSLSGANTGSISSGNCFRSLYGNTLQWFTG
jgi:hypothetical protein